MNSMWAMKFGIYLAMLLAVLGPAQGESIFDLEPAATTRPAIHITSKPRWREQPVVSWEAAARGIVRLTSGGAVIRAVRPATRETPGVVMEHVASPTTWPAEFAPVSMREDINLYTEIYSGREREAEGHADEIASLIKNLIRASHYTTANTTFKRYLLLRTFVLARSPDAELGLTRTVCRELWPLVEGDSPGMLAQARNWRERWPRRSHRTTAIRQRRRGQARPGRLPSWRFTKSITIISARREATWTWPNISPRQAKRHRPLKR